MLLLGPLVAITAAPAQAAATVDCPPMGSETCQQITPIAECVWDNKNGTKSVVWGWKNPTSSTARIGFGSHNDISPGAADQGQGTLFSPGVHHNVFFTTFSGSSASWRLGNNDAATGKSTLACSTKPVPQVGSVAALLTLLALLGLAGLLVVSSRGRRLAVSP